MSAGKSRGTTSAAGPHSPADLVAGSVSGPCALGGGRLTVVALSPFSGPCGASASQFNRFLRVHR
jgi:aldehyde:ferredoxin oxidoreductase